jgi:5'-deoxynucleotidase YfbR-like HD superfamily hydrolase
LNTVDEKMRVKTVADAVAKLKNIPRTGWLQRGVPSYDAETVAEHTFEVASLLIILSFALKEEFDRENMLVMGLIHDLGESVSGDIPRGIMNKKSKSKTERKIVREIAIASGLRNLEKKFNEYVEGESREALLVKVADRVSTMRQAKIYLKRGYDVKDIMESCKEEIDALVQKMDDAEIKYAVTELIK